MVSKLEWFVGGIFLIVAAIGLISFINYTIANPHGRYDAWAIWNVRARMLARAGDHWKTIFIPQVFHADYPLLIPMTIAHSWMMAGTESQRIPPGSGRAIYLQRRRDTHWCLVGFEKERKRLAGRYHFLEHTLGYLLWIASIFRSSTCSVHTRRLLHVCAWGCLTAPTLHGGCSSQDYVPV